MDRAIREGRVVNAFMSPTTGEVVVYAPSIWNGASGVGTVAERMAQAMERGQQVVAHEVLAHQGLRQLLGEEAFKELCEQIYKGMSKYARAKYVRYHWDNNLSEETKKRLVGEDLASKSWDQLTPIEKAQVWANPEMATELRQGAADEYAAHLAEKVIGNETLTAKEQSIWEKIVSAIKKLFGQMDDTAIADALVQARDNLRQGEQAQAQLLGEEEARTVAENPQFSVQDMSEAQLDRAYFDAMEAGDEARMREVLNEVAQRRGYDTNEDWRWYHSAPVATDAVQDDDGTLYSWTLADEANNNPNRANHISDSYYSSANINGSRDESMRAIQNAISAIRRGDDPMVTIYRAVPRKVKEGNVRNGDWVTMSRAYADAHGRMNISGPYRIIEEQVPASQLYWDGNDINEWGFDDGKEYRYRNTKNNRKLDDLVTRDDNGNVIAPSRRFNNRNEDVRFSTDEEVAQANERFNEELQQQIDGTQEAGHAYQLGMPNKILRAAGFPYLPIELTATQLANKAKQHNFDISDMKGLVEAINNPVAIFKYGDEKKAQNVIVEIERDGKNFVVGIHFYPNGAAINSIRGLNNKNTPEWLNWITQNKLLWVDKEKIQPLIFKQQTNPADVKYLDLDSIAKIIQDFENPKFIGENLQGNGEFNTPQGEARFSAEEQENGENIPYSEEDKGEIPIRYSIGERAYIGTNRATGEKRYIDFTRDDAQRVTDEVDNALKNRYPDVRLDKGGAQTGSNYRTLRFPNGSELRIRLSDHTKADTEEGLDNNMRNGIWWYDSNEAKPRMEAYIDISRNNMNADDIVAFADRMAEYDRDGFPEDMTRVIDETKKNSFHPWTDVNNPQIDEAFGMVIAPIERRNSVAEGEEAPANEDLFARAERIADEYQKQREQQREEAIRFRAEYNRESARDAYENAVRSGLFQSVEALQDSQRSVFVAMKSILGQKRFHIEDVPDFMNAYTGENRLSSVNQAEMEIAARQLFEVLVHEYMGVYLVIS